MKHSHSIAKYEFLMEYSGYDDRYGYVYGYRETCACGASRINQYKSAGAAAEAHQHLDTKE